jgi:hypothetical protein
VDQPGGKSWGVCACWTWSNRTYHRWVPAVESALQHPLEFCCLQVVAVVFQVMDA